MAPPAERVDYVVSGEASRLGLKQTISCCKEEWGPVVSGEASRLGLKLKFEDVILGRRDVVSGEASRLGLKLPCCEIAAPKVSSGQWRGFPPGIETMSRFECLAQFYSVVSGEASRLGLKQRAIACCRRKENVVSGEASRLGLKPKSS